MKFLPLIWAGLWRKPLRALLTLMAVVTAFLSLGLLGFVDSGFRQLVNNSREDRLMIAPAFAAQISQAAVDQLRAMPEIKHLAALGIVGGTFQAGRENLSVQFTDDAYFDLRDDLIISPAQRKELAETPTGVVISPSVARRYALKAGDTFTITSVLGVRRDGSHIWTLQVVAVVPSKVKEDDFLAIGNHSYYKEERAANRTGYFRVWVQIVDGSKASALAKEIDRTFGNSPSPTRTVSERAMLQAGSQSLGDIHLFINVVSGAVLFVLLLLTANTLAQSVRERTGEFAVMHALGYTRADTITIVCAEAVLLCLVGATLGLALSVPIAPMLARVADLPSPKGIQWSTLSLGLAVAVLTGGISSALPMQRLRRFSVIDVLAGR